jgi:hypothetical protein
VDTKDLDHSAKFGIAIALNSWYQKTKNWGLNHLFFQFLKYKIKVEVPCTINYELPNFDIDKLWIPSFFN